MAASVARGGAGSATARSESEDDAVAPAAGSQPRALAGGTTARVVRTLRPGDATNYPAKGQTCRIHYVGQLEDGTCFDSSRVRGLPFEFRLGAGQVVAGFEEVLPAMSRGQIAVVRVPPERAYGLRGYPPIIPPGATLIFEIELISFA
jgi:FK506-binding protein 1